MAQRVQIQLIDDIDEGPASETVSFSLDGVSYEIDLSQANAGRLRDALAPWVGNARRVSGRKTSRVAGVKNDDNAKIRAWAIENGLEVSSRGRISSEIRQAYIDAVK